MVAALGQDEGGTGDRVGDDVGVQVEDGRHQLGVDHLPRGTGGHDPAGAHGDDVVGVAGASPAASEGEGEQDEMAVFGGRMLRMLLNSLYMLEQRTKPAALIKGVFEMRTAALSGFCPSLECCALCGKETPAGAYLDVMNGRLLCDACKARLNRGGIGAASEEALGERSILIPLTEPVLAAMRFALAAPDRKIFSFSLEMAQAEAFSSATEVYLLNHLEHGFETLNFYRSVASSAERAVTKDRGGSQ